MQLRMLKMTRRHRKCNGRNQAIAPAQLTRPSEMQDCTHIPLSTAPSGFDYMAKIWRAKLAECG